jgi:hypothetical protein
MVIYIVIIVLEFFIILWLIHRLREIKANIQNMDIDSKAESDKYFMEQEDDFNYLDEYISDDMDSFFRY